MRRNAFGKSWGWENGFDIRGPVVDQKILYGGCPGTGILIRMLAVAGGYCGRQRLGLSRQAEVELDCIEYGVVEADVRPLFKGIKLGISDL